MSGNLEIIGKGHGGVVPPMRLRSSSNNTHVP
jgi:hypothetical protein